MRINKHLAQATGLSRRAADAAIDAGRVRIDDVIAKPGDQITGQQRVSLDGRIIQDTLPIQTIIFHKPIGYVVSRDGQGSRTIYDILPPHLHHLKPVGRLDKYSSGLLLITNDGDLANQLTHPSQKKVKIYDITLNKPLEPLHHQMISDNGIALEDGISLLPLEKMHDNGIHWRIRMHEGRNRQIRRTFAVLGYTVINLHRIQFGPYNIGNIKSSQYRTVQ